MKALLVTVGVCLLACSNLTAQPTPWSYNSNGLITGYPNSTLSHVSLDPTVAGGAGTSLVINGASLFTALNFRLAGADKWVMGVGVYRSSTDYSIGNASAEKFTLQSVTGNVGIGTVVPNARLSLGGSSGIKLLAYDDPGISPNYKMGLGVNLAGISSSIDVTMGRGDGTDNSFNVVKPIGAWPYSDLGYTRLLTVLESGYVGIGMVPGKALDVTGDIRATGNISGGTVTATFQDVAEWVPSSGQLPPGTVVVVGDRADNTVVPSRTAYDSRVAGVVSPAPGLLLGVESPSKSKVATTGRVRVRVDATKAAIRLGDLLVTSDTPGTAMKSEPLDLGGVKIHRPGTLIGKALEPLAHGQGEILVLLSLQ